MEHYPLLITLDGHSGPLGSPNQVQVYSTTYRQGTQLEEDQIDPLTPVARGCLGLGWAQGEIPLLQHIGRGQKLPPGIQYEINEAGILLGSGQKCRLSPCLNWRWSLHPQTSWPAPHQLLEFDFRQAQQRVVWSDPTAEIIDLQVDGPGSGCYLAVQSKLGWSRLIHWDATSGKSQCLFRHPDFRPGEFCISQAGDWLIYVHQEDDRLYHVNLKTRRQRSLPSAQPEIEQIDGRRAYRTSLSLSPDNRRLFYCTAYLELCGLELVNWGHLYVLDLLSGHLRPIELPTLEPACPLAVASAPPPLVSLGAGPTSLSKNGCR